MPSLLQSLVNIESDHASTESATASPVPTTPAKVFPRTYPSVPQRDNSIEIGMSQQNISQPEASTSSPSSHTEAQIEVGGDVEMTRYLAPANAPDMESDDGIPALQSVWDPYMNRYRLLSVCMLSFGNGMKDSAPGALLPYIEEYYGIGYLLVSLIFVGNALGYITAAPFIDSIRGKLGRAKTLALSQTLITLGFIPIVATAPFVVVVLSFFVIGLGQAINNALGNTFCGSLQSGTTALGAMHGSYGIGGTVGPLIATSIVTLADTVWSRYYLLTLGMAALNAVFAAWAFWNYERDSASPSNTQSDFNYAGMFSPLASRNVILGALFVFAYQGAEVSIAGWVISFLITNRGGNPSSIGYVTAGFWGGITLGRFLLSTPAHRIGEKTFVYGAIVLSTVFELLVWLVPNILGDAISVSIVGLLLGPVYPCAAALLMNSIGRRERVSGIGAMTAFGSSGGAVAPFLTGVLAQVAGTFVLHPIVIGLFGVMLICWYKVPPLRRRRE
ncbi:Putative mfs efflux protein [Trichoderma simmonsii]|uniref:Mfs efflux protein n=1 Tax=Trichoderma simmonsii TaxID=1491479 RepID=A0A8G0LAZ5_9HYPO|nr:Putative mfs efflux protein [Trichoderma simmonsii]